MSVTNRLSPSEINQLKTFADGAKAFRSNSERFGGGGAGVTLQIAEVFDNSDGLFRLYTEMELKHDKPSQWTLEMSADKYVQGLEKKWLFEVVGIEVAVNPTDKNAMVYMRQLKETVLKEPGFYLGDMMCTRSFLQAPKEFILYWLAWARLRTLNMPVPPSRENPEGAPGATNIEVDVAATEIVAREYRNFTLDKVNQILDTLIINQPKGIDQVPAEIKKFLHVFSYAKQKMVLNPETQALYEELLIEWKNKDAFREHNIPVRHKILFHGPSGNGKTTIARNLSIDIGLPFFEIKQDQIINAHYGETGKNLATIFGYLKYPCILFFDEIDSFLNKRGNKNDMPEVDRALNTFLVYLEKLSADVILIGATNRLEDMDSAGVRRFDVRHELPAPDKDSKISLIDQLTGYYKLGKSLPTAEKNEICEKCMSYSYIQDYMVQRARREVFLKIKAK